MSKGNKKKTKKSKTVASLSYCPATDGKTLKAQLKFAQVIKDLIELQLDFDMMAAKPKDCEVEDCGCDLPELVSLSDEMLDNFKPGDTVTPVWGETVTVSGTYEPVEATEQQLIMADQIQVLNEENALLRRKLYSLNFAVWPLIRVAKESGSGGALALAEWDNLRPDLSGVL